VGRIRALTLLHKILPEIKIVFEIMNLILDLKFSSTAVNIKIVDF
jgi:hypothetical protein